MRIKLNVGTTVSRPLPTGETIYLKVRNITLISDDSMPFVHVEFDRWTTNGSVDKVTAVFGEVVQWLNSYSDWKIEESVSFVCPDCQRVTVDMADVKALEADNKRMRNEIMRLQSDNVELLLLRDMEHERCRAERQEADNIRASRLAIAESLDVVMRERDLLKAQLTATWQPIDVRELARTRRIGCVCTEGCQDAAGVYPNNILQVVNKVEQRYADIKLPANVRLCEQVPS